VYLKLDKPQKPVFEFLNRKPDRLNHMPEVRTFIGQGIRVDLVCKSCKTAITMGVPFEIREAKNICLACGEKDTLVVPESPINWGAAMPDGDFQK